MRMGVGGVLEGDINNECNQWLNNGCRDSLTVKKTERINQPEGNSVSADEVKSHKDQQ